MHSTSPPCLKDRHVSPSSSHTRNLDPWVLIPVPKGAIALLTLSRSNFPPISLFLTHTLPLRPCR